jgi:hypothetical protein
VNVSEILAKGEPEPDADREGIRVLLACAAAALPALCGDELVIAAPLLYPQLAQYGRVLLAEVAQRMEL